MDPLMAYCQVHLPLVDSVSMIKESDKERQIVIMFTLMSYVLCLVLCYGFLCLEEEKALL